ncbi:MAG: UDP-N-acetylmuramate--L-alanine ligase [Clostridia bacterium]|nr:UDP-N-acetylmuramate--L-alanine ligase [Clostridia bacterium]
MSLFGSDLEKVRNADLVVYTAAISQDDPELLEANKLNIKTCERAVFLGKLTKAFKDTIGISGTHGKTTTTSLVSLCFIKAGFDPTVQVGAILKQLNGNYRIGNSDFLILEACEYVESFLHFHPKAEIVLNIDNDHLDYFKNLDNIKNAFTKYIGLLPDDGLLVYNADDKNSIGLNKHTKAKSVTFGIENSNADFIAKNIKFDKNGFASFDVYHLGEFLDNFSLSISGMHNVLNAMACIALCTNYGISTSAIKEAFVSFTGANRRLEYKGSFNNISVYDDYAHHPTEIKATAAALNRKIFNESWVVFQPHTYSRLKNLLDDFTESLLDFDHIILTDVYAAREKNIFNISSKDLADKMIALGKPALYIPNFEDIVKFLKANTHSEDIILTLGAGTVTNIGPMLVNKKFIES